jgi:hypothetical protein
VKDAVQFWDWFWLLLIQVPIFLLWFFCLADVFRRGDLSGGAKAGWVAVVVLIPLIGALIYLAVRPGPDRSG